MDAALQDFAQGMREALAIWLALLAAVIITFFIMSALSRRGRDAGPSWWSRVRKAVNAAHQRGEISAAHPAAALMHRNGWDPAAPPFAQELMLRRVIRDRQFHAYQEASEVERQLATAADMAAAAKRSLDDEAFDAD